MCFGLLVLLVDFPEFGNMTVQDATNNHSFSTQSILIESINYSSRLFTVKRFTYTVLMKLLNNTQL